jgi:hypothetical protein
MIIKTKYLLLTFFSFIVLNIFAQNNEFRNYQLGGLLTPFRVPLPEKILKYIDLDKDADPDVLEVVLKGKKAIWIDDDDDMKTSDIEGDMDNDCLLIDINGDGKYGSEMDIIVDYIDSDNDQKADWQMIADNGKISEKGKWMSHYMWFQDLDKDGVFGYINWNSFKFEGWDHDGMSNFYTDYNGKSLMLKVHISSWNLENIEYNWENPFLYYDPDNDGLTEMAIRLVDEPQAINSLRDTLISWKFSKKISLSQMTFDLDNDNSSGNELDFDMSLKFKGDGFSYKNQNHNLGKYLVESHSDIYFDDPRIRHLKYLVYPDHDTAYAMTVDCHDWEYCWFIFDEDDDCQRWERVEFYEPLDPFKIGAKKRGLDNNPQADASGDRGEWDLDFSGKGNLYISPLDGKIHLFGAEKGYWRIDQQALYYQGWQGWRGENLQPEDFENLEPSKFATIKYEDTDGNGFFDKIGYDMDGDTLFESNFSIFDYLDTDSVALFVIKDKNFNDFSDLFKSVANKSFDNALSYTEWCRDQGLYTEHYSFLMNPKSLHEKYNYGFWLKYYLLADVLNLAKLKKDGIIQKEATRKYFSIDF